MSEKLSDEAEVLYRQIHPNFMQDGQPSSDRFRPSELDEGQLSLDRASMTTPADSHGLYTENGYASAAVFGVSVGEFGAESINCLSDPLKATEKQKANPAHALADYNGHEAKKHKTIAKRLKQKAVARGQLHPPKPE